MCRFGTLLPSSAPRLFLFSSLGRQTAQSGFWLLLRASPPLSLAGSRRLRHNFDHPRAARACSERFAYECTRLHRVRVRRSTAATDQPGASSTALRSRVQPLSDSLPAPDTQRNSRHGSTQTDTHDRGWTGRGALDASSSIGIGRHRLSLVRPPLAIGLVRRFVAGDPARPVRGGGRRLHAVARESECTTGRQQRRRSGRTTETETRLLSH